jgi:hypothetical protein
MAKRWMVVLLTFGPLGTMWNFVSDGEDVVKTFGSKRQAEVYRKSNHLSSQMRSMRVSIRLESPLPTKMNRRKT